MLKTTLLHPEILSILSQGGHHSKILIADGNYPTWNKRGPNSEIVSLQLMPGIPTVSHVLRALLASIPIDEVATMDIPADDPYAHEGEPSAWNDYRNIIEDSGLDLELTPILKWEFYDAVDSGDHILTIQTAEQRPWANLLLTMGCRTF